MLKPEEPQTEAEVLRRGFELLAARLPSDWSASISGTEIARGADAIIDVVSANGQKAVLVVEAKRVVEGRDVDVLRSHLDRYRQQFPASTGVVFARYLSRPVQRKLSDAGLSYIDATGNMQVRADEPAFYLADRGADNDPWRGKGRPRGTLKGEPAAKVVRALVDFGRPWTMRELVDVGRASTGATYRVVDYLESEGLITRDDVGSFEMRDWPQLLRRWSEDYGFIRSNNISRWIAPRGLPGLIEKIVENRNSVRRYAVTGTIAAAEWAAYAPARNAMIYVDDATAAAEVWGLRPADAGANVLLAEAVFPVVFERSLTNMQSVCVAAQSQVVVDLMTGPGRNPSEAEELLQWMQNNESSWRG